MADIGRTTWTILLELSDVITVNIHTPRYESIDDRKFQKQWLPITLRLTFSKWVTHQCVVEDLSPMITSPSM